MEPFRGSFTQQEALSSDAILAATEVMQSGRLHRYNTTEGDFSPVAELEKDFASYQGQTYCVACASGGYAMATALRAAGVKPGDTVLTNSFTLAPVPGAIASLGAHPILVETNDELTIDFDDLKKKITQSQAKVLLLSHTRGHICDMDALLGILQTSNVALIEDCAHTMGASWNGRPSGTFGLAGCFSTQTYKHINSGEGGFLTSCDPEFMAKAVIMSGSYMLYDRNGTVPEARYFEKTRLVTPNISGRMDNLRAAILIPQLQVLNHNVKRWNARYDYLCHSLAQTETIIIPKRSTKEQYVGSSIQFLLPHLNTDEAEEFLDQAKNMGVELKWFGRVEPLGFTSNHYSWQYLQKQELPKTDRIIAGLFDMRIPLTFSLEDCARITEIIKHCLSAYNTKKSQFDNC